MPLKNCIILLFKFDNTNTSIYYFYLFIYLLIYYYLIYYI